MLIRYIAKLTLCKGYNVAYKCLLLLLKDFATPSLNCCDNPAVPRIEDDDDVDENEEDGAVDVVQLSLRRHWETR